MSDKEIRLGFPGNVKKIDNAFPADAQPAWGVDAKLDSVGKDHPRVDARAKAGVVDFLEAVARADHRLRQLEQRGQIDRRGDRDRTRHAVHDSTGTRFVMLLA